MAYKVISIPGGSTTYDDCPRVQIISSDISKPTLIIKYIAGEFVENQPQLYGEITFLQVMEYRWVAFDYAYSPYQQDEQGEGFELIQIIDSKWIENIAAKGWFQKYPGQRFGPVIQESDVKHFRITFDDYGIFDIIAFDISVKEIFE